MSKKDSLKDFNMVFYTAAFLICTFIYFLDILTPKEYFVFSIICVTVICSTAIYTWRKKRMAESKAAKEIEDAMGVAKEQKDKVKENSSEEEMFGIGKKKEEEKEEVQLEEIGKENTDLSQIHNFTLQLRIKGKNSINIVRDVLERVGSFDDIDIISQDLKEEKA